MAPDEGTETVGLSVGTRRSSTRGTTFGGCARSIGEGLAGGGGAGSAARGAAGAAVGAGVDVSRDDRACLTRSAAATRATTPIACHARWRDERRGARGNS